MTSPSIPPAGVPQPGNGKYIVGTLLLFGLIGGVVVWKKSQTPDVPVVPSAAPSVSATAPVRKIDDDIPLPPPVEDAGPETGPTKALSGGPQTWGCDVKACTGTPAGDLESVLAFRARAAHKCYDAALASDSALSGGVTIALRIGTNGAPCSASVASNSTGNAAVAACIAASMRGSTFPAPKGGCVQVNVPISLKSR